MATQKSILLNDWQNGIGKSRYTGFEFMKCVNLDEDGVLKINYKPSLMDEDASEPIIHFIKWQGYGRVSASSYRIFATADNEIRYLDLASGDWEDISGTTANPDGFGSGICWGGSQTAKDFLLFIDGANMSALDCSTFASPTFTYNFITTLATDCFYRPMFVASNNRVYIGNGHKLAELKENSGQTFAPGTSATYTFTPNILDLPSSFEISCLAEMGDYLVIGTKNPYYPTCSHVFLWDKVSASFEQPIVVNAADGVNQIQVYKGVMFIQAGSLGDWFYSLGTVAEKCAEIPKHVRGNSYFSIYPNGCVVVEDKIYFGVGGGTIAAGLLGIWSLDTRKVSKNNIQECLLEHTISNGVDGTTGVVYIDGMLAVSNKGFRYGWYTTVGETSTYAIDSVNNGFANDSNVSDRMLYGSSEAYMISPFYRVGTYRTKRVITHSEIQLAKALDTNESVVIQYRTERDGTWVAYHTFNTTGKQSCQCPAITDLESVQFKIILDTGTAQTSGPELLSIEFFLN